MYYYYFIDGIRLDLFDFFSIQLLKNILDKNKCLNNFVLILLQNQYLNPYYGINKL